MTSTDTTSAPQGQYVQANSLNIYYEEYGSGRPLILIHGGTVTSSMWRADIPLFAKHFRVIAPDSRGHGRTNNPTGKFSHRVMADDVAAFVQALSLTNPLVYGYTMAAKLLLRSACVIQT